MSPEAAKEHLQIATKWMLRDIDASAEQQDRVNAIVNGAVDDLFRLRERHQQNRIAKRVLRRPRAHPRRQVQQFLGEKTGRIRRGNIGHGKTMARFVRCSKWR